MHKQVVIVPGGVSICEYTIPFERVDDVRCVRSWLFWRKSLVITTNNSIITLRGSNREIMETYESIRLSMEAVTHL